MEMVKAVYAEMNIFALIILLVVFLSSSYKVHRYTYEQRTFLCLLIINAVQVTLSTALFIIDGAPGRFMRILNITFDVIEYIFTPFTFFFWCLYVRYQVYRDAGKANRIVPVLLIPVFINFVLTVLSPIKGYFFWFDEYNVYHRGPLFGFYSLICVSYMVGIQIFIIAKRKLITRKYFIPLFAFALVPILAGVLQIFFYGIKLVWTSMTVSVLIISMHLQNNQLYIDHLTGLSNRRQLDRYLKEYSRRKSKKSDGKLIGGIMIDMDFFKNINDIWGHAVGDQALVDAGEILKMSFGKDDLIARYGGDEFVIIFEITDVSELIEAVDRIKANIKKFQKANKAPYLINFSMGYDIYNPEQGTTWQQFLSHIDRLMYENKKDKRIIV